MEEQSVCSFPVDLTREEYLQFAYLQGNRYNPKRQKGICLGVSLVCVVLLVALLVMDWVTLHTVDPLLVAAIPFVLIPTAYVLWILPPLLRRRAGKAYDKAVGAGRHFFGEVRLYPDRVEKDTAYGCVKIPLHGHSFFVETPELMAFVSRFAPAIILPARCMTDTAAAAARKAADRLPITNRRFLGRLQPQAQPVPVPPQTPPLPVLWECTFTYTGDELVEMSRRILLARFWRMAPFYALFSLLLSVSLYVTGTEFQLVPLIAVFLLLFGLLVVVNLVLPLARLRRTADLVPREDRTKRLYIDELGVHTYADLTGDSLLAWKEQEIHIYDKEPFAEIAVKNQTALYLPKRCIEDVDAFNAVIAQCRKG